MSECGFLSTWGEACTEDYNTCIHGTIGCAFCDEAAWEYCSKVLDDSSVCSTPICTLCDGCYKHCEEE